MTANEVMPPGKEPEVSVAWKRRSGTSIAISFWGPHRNFSTSTKIGVTNDVDFRRLDDKTYH